MADVATVNVPERSLLERVARVPSLLNQGVESMVAGTLSLPALVADGYLNMYRSARQAMGGEAFQASNLYERSKASITNAGRTMDGTKGKVIEAETNTEKNIVFGAELVTGLVGPGALKSVKTLSEGVSAAKAATVARTEAAVASTTASATTTATTAASTSNKVRLATANEDALSVLAKAKAEGEAARLGATTATTSAAAGNTAKAAASVGDDFAKASTAGYSSTAAAATNTAKTVTKEAVEATSKGLLGQAAGMAWTGTKAVWNTGMMVTAPARFAWNHKIMTASLIGGAHLATDGASSRLLWGGAVGGWNLTKEYAPAVASTVAEGGLKLGDGFMGFLATGGKMGAGKLADHLPPGVSAPVRAVLGSVGPQATENGTSKPSLTERARDALTGHSNRTPGANTANDEDENDADILSSHEAGPFRDMIAKQLNMDPAKVTGKELTAKLGALAADNPYFAAGMAFGSIYGMMGEGKSKKERFMGSMVYGALFGVAFQILGQLYPGLGSGLMKMLSAAPDALAKVPSAIGLNTSSLNGGFKAAAEGTAPAPTSAPAQQGPSTPVASKFEQAASGKPALAPAPAPEDVDLRRNRPEAANNAAYRLSVGAPA